MLLFLFTLWPHTFISLTGCRSHIFIVGEMKRCWGHCSELRLKASHLLLNLVTQPFTCVQRHWLLTENKDHTHRHGPSPGWMDSFTQQQNVISSANWKSWRPKWLLCLCTLEARAEFVQAAQLRPQSGRRRHQREERTGWQRWWGKDGGLALLLAPQPWPS